MASDDPLLSVSQIARYWGTGLDVVTSLVAAGALPSLDGGTLVRQDHLDIPLIRQSWAEFMRHDSDGAGRILRPPDGQAAHPAFQVSLDVVSALDKHDADGLWAHSSKRSQEGHTRKSLLARWTEINAGGYPEGSGVGSTIYSLAPLPAVGARIFANTPTIPRAVVKPTPATLIAVLPFVWEEGEWKVDLPLYAGDESDVFLPTLLTSPAPEGACLDPSQPDEAVPSRSHPPKA
jgi:hypothetical protein